MPRTNTYKPVGSGTHDPDALLSISEAAQILGFTTQTLRNWDKKGKFVPARTPGKRRVYRYADVEAQLARLRGVA